MTEAAIEAGYSDKFPRQSGHQAIENIKKKAPGLFERHGLDDDAFIDKYILPALEAKEVRAHYDSSMMAFCYSDPLVDWSTRRQMNRLVAEMKGLVVKEQETPKEGIRVLLIDRSHRPKTVLAPPTINIPGLTMPQIKEA